MSERREMRVRSEMSERREMRVRSEMRVRRDNRERFAGLAGTALHGASKQEHINNYQGTRDCVPLFIKMHIIFKTQLLIV